MILEGRVVVDAVTRCFFEYSKLTGKETVDTRDRDTLEYLCDNEGREAPASAPASQGLPGARSPKESPLRDSEGPGSMHTSGTARQYIAMVLSPVPLVGLYSAAVCPECSKGGCFSVCVPRFPQMERLAETWRW